MKIIHLLVAALFFFFVVVQYNDPDFLIWTMIYLPMALIAIYAFRNKHNHIFNLVYAAGLLIFLIFNIEDLVMWVDDGFPSMMDEENTPNVEGIREFMGVAIAFVLAMVYYYVARNAVKKNIHS